MWENQNKTVEIAKVELQNDTDYGVIANVHIRTILDADDREQLEIDEAAFARSGAKIKYSNGLGKHSFVLVTADEFAVAGHRVEFNKPEIKVTVTWETGWNSTEEKHAIYESWLSFQIRLTLIGRCPDTLWSLITSEIVTLHVCSEDASEEEVEVLRRALSPYPPHPAITVATPDTAFANGEVN